jgi:hypothetical protein
MEMATEARQFLTVSVGLGSVSPHPGPLPKGEGEPPCCAGFALELRMGLHFVPHFGSTEYSTTTRTV